MKRATWAGLYRLDNWGHRLLGRRGHRLVMGRLCDWLDYSMTNEDEPFKEWRRSQRAWARSQKARR